MKIALLDNKKSIANLVEVDTNKSILDFIDNELKKDEFNFIVTSDNIPAAKKSMADLNKSKDYIITFRKEKVDSESVAIDTFKNNVKVYVALVESKREEIKKNVEVFEREQKALITKELGLYADELLKSQNIRSEFNSVDLADLIVFGSVTPKGALTKKARESIESRVNVCKTKQDKYDMRLLMLENLSYQSGLSSPLTITHIQGIINIDSDAEYDLKLKELISSEIEREKKVKENIQREADEKAQREAHQEVLDGQNRIISLFNSIATDSSLTTDEKIDKVSNYDVNQFAQLSGFASAKVQSVITELTQYQKSFEQSQKHDTSKVKDKEIPIVHETITDEPDMKVVTINVKLQFKVKKSIADDRIVGKVSQMLHNAGFDESLLSVEVV